MMAFVLLVSPFSAQSDKHQTALGQGGGDIAVEGTQAILDVVVLLFLLSVYYICRRLLSQNNNDAMFQQENVILSWFGKLILAYIFFRAVKLVYGQVTVYVYQKDFSEFLLALGTLLCVVVFYLRSALWLKLKKCTALCIAFTSHLENLIWMIKRAVTIPFFWVLRDTVDINLRLSILGNCVAFVAILLYFTTSREVGVILSYFFLLAVGKYVNHLA